MVGRLEKAGYVETKHYKGVKLSDEGLKQRMYLLHWLILLLDNPLFLQLTSFHLTHTFTLLSSVSEMVGRLEKAGYVETKHYKGVKLSDEGLKHTLDIIKRHRLLELFLIEVLCGHVSG
jgi:Mn-dependent DtxR family transcriptional regulator